MVEALTIKVFGEPVSDFNSADKTVEKELGRSFTIVKVYGVQLNGTCTRMENPVLLVLPGKGLPAEGCGFDESANLKMWQVKKDTLATKINVVSAPVTALLDEKSIQGIGISVRLENVRHENGKVTGTVRFEIDAGIGRINHGVDFSIDTNIGNWITIWNTEIVPGLLKGEVKVRISSLNKICARVEASAKLPDTCSGPFGIPIPCLKWKSASKDFCLSF